MTAKVPYVPDAGKPTCQFRFLDGRTENHRVRPCRGEELPLLYTILVENVEHGLFGETVSVKKHVFERRTVGHPDIKRAMYFYQEV